MTILVDPTTEPLDDEGFMQDIGLGVVIAIVTVVAIVFVVRALLDRRLSRPAKLADHELVTLTGIVRPAGATLLAPLSARACVAYRVRAVVIGEEGSSEGRSVFGKVPAGVGAEPIEKKSVAFTLETRNGPIAVGDEPLELAVTPERLPPKPTRERAFLEQFGLADQHDRAGFDEVAVPVGAKIAIRGMLRIEADALASGERGYRDEGPRRMRLIANGDEPIKVLRVW